MGCNNSKADAPKGSGGAPSGNIRDAAAPVNMPRKESITGIDHGKFVTDNPGHIEDFYQVDKTKLGEGTYGSVSKAKNKATGATRACKSMCKSAMKGKNLALFQKEIAAMKMMDHPNILKLYETFEDMHNVYLIMELCTGGELFERIIEVGNLTEVQAAFTMQQIMRGIYYMHEMKLVHRDLKPENFLLQNKDPVETVNLKIIDFGLACQCSEDTVLKTKAGTAYYIAPEVLAGAYNKECDIWSCGVIMYVLLCGYPPFYAECDKEVLELVKAGDFEFRRSDWKNVSEDAQVLIQEMLKLDPKERYTAPQVLQHEWIKDHAPHAENVPLSSSLVDNLKHFRANNKLKKLALYVIATQLDDDQISGLRKVFQQLDDNGDGVLTVQEMKEGLEKAGLKEIPPDLKEIMEQVDSDGSGEIDYTEFLAATLDKHHYMQEDVIWSAFLKFDLNGDGVISMDELEQVLHSDDVEKAMGAECLKKLMQECDTNGDGEIDFQEFMEMMRAGHEAPSKEEKQCENKFKDLVLETEEKTIIGA